MSDLTSVRDEDAFDIAKVHNWLSQYIEESELPEVKQFRSGASNLTYLLKYPDLELVLRRPPIGTKAVSAHDMKREFLIQSRYVRITQLLDLIFM
jgi:aminoglycoside phosphotransferase (APT) family kinase protein